MKPKVLLAVQMHPKRNARALEWLKTVNPEFCEVVYMKATAPGPPIRGSNNQLFTGAPIFKAVFENVYEQWTRARDEEFRYFGFCCDDVMVNRPVNPLEKMVLYLNYNRDVNAVGCVNNQMKTFNFRTCLMRFWVAYTKDLDPTCWDELWSLYQMPDWEPPWQYYSGLECRLFPEIEYCHLRPAHEDLSRPYEGWRVECYRGLEARGGRRGEIVFE